MTMQQDVRLRIAQQAFHQYYTGKMTRRKMLRVLGSVGLAAAAAPLLARAAKAQEGTPEGGTPPMAATPVLGPQSDGTTTWKVAVGGMNMETGAGYNIFLPEEITINVGDRIFFENSMGFHTISFLSGEPVKPAFVPAPEGVAAPATPQAAAADKPQLMFNPEIVLPAGNGSYDGTGYVNSGVPLDPSAPPFVLTFTKPGTYDYICLIHQKLMKGKVTVQAAGSAVAKDQAAIDQEVAAKIAELDQQAKTLLDEANAATATPTADGAHEVWMGVGKDYIDYFNFVPYELNVKAGDKVRWLWKSSQEPHTVTFLGGAPAPEDILVQPQQAGPPLFFVNPNSIYASDKQGEYAGDGLVNSGYLGGQDIEALSAVPIDLPDSYELTFTAAGEYKYYCILHAGGPDDPPTQGMTGKVIVS
jgi:plastocyanin